MTEDSSQKCNNRFPLMVGLCVAVAFYYRFLFPNYLIDTCIIFIINFNFKTA